MTKKPKARMDEIELAKSIFDEIVEETESENWNKPKNKKPQKKSIPANLCFLPPGLKICSLPVLTGRNSAAMEF